MTNQKTLARKVHENLVDLGIETPMVQDMFNDDQHTQGHIENHMYDVHRVLGLDLTDDSIQDTPRRIAKLMVNESMSGLNYNNFPKMTVVENKFYDGLVSVNDLTIVSLCEHHWERIIMKVSIAYVPDKNVLGLSKFSRLADFFASRPIVQERYTSQLFETIKLILGTEHVAVHVRGVHLCMYARGVTEPCSNTTTTLLGGRFKTCEILRQEFLHGIDVTKPIIGV